MSEGKQEPLVIDLGQLPEEVAGCHRIILELAKQAGKDQALIEWLQHRLEQLLKARYGPRSDRLEPGPLLRDQQLETAAAAGNGEATAAGAGEDKAAKEEKPRQRRNGGGRNPFPAHLPRQEVIIRVAAEDRTCPHSGQARPFIGFETHLYLEYESASVRVVEEKREKYGQCSPDCPYCGVTTAAKPAHPIEKGSAGPGMLARVIVSKFGDHLPLYRLEANLRRDKVEISRQTMCGWMVQSAGILEPLYDLKKKLILAGPRLQTDDTPVSVQDPDYPKRTKTGRIWIYVGDRDHPYTVFDYTPNRSRDGPVEFLGDFRGKLQADAYSGYDGVFKDGRVIEVGCWAHARRRFAEAQNSDRVRASYAVVTIGELYDIERDIKGGSDEQRRAARRARAVPILRRFKFWLLKAKAQVLPKSPMAEAINYVLNQWRALRQYTKDGALEIDNNASENGLRPIVLGRKNWIFFGSDNGGRTAAILYSIVLSAKRHGLNEFEYVRDVLTRINTLPSKQLPDLLPDRWKALREQAAAAARDSTAGDEAPAAAADSL